MTSRLEILLDRLETATSLEDIQGLVELFRDNYQVTHTVYHIVGDSGREYGAFTYDMKWVQRYIDMKYFRIDPVVTESLKRFHPIDWRRLDWSGAPQRRLMEEAVAAGVGKQGLTIPIRSVNGQNALFSVTSYMDDREWDEFLSMYNRDLLLAAHSIHQKVMQVMGEAPDILGAELSPRERDALTLLASGQSRAEAAENLKISEHTFRVYVDTARHKLGALNTTHAVALALSRGLILGAPLAH
jgi:DNA-binding CsgD family transcriptional regulator